MMDTLELFQRLGVALAIGFLIGLERGWKARNEPEGARAAGVRTHALGGLLGGVWGALAVTRENDGLIAIALAFAVYSGAVLLFRYRESLDEKTYGVTTVVAAMLTFALGALAVMGDMAVAGGMGVAAAALLAFKDVLHGWIGRISWPELRSGLLLAAMTFILLPMLPDRTIDPWNTINPFEMWLLTVMIAAISFAGYIAIKAVGDEAGIVMTGVAGGLASSTAVTVTLAEMAKEHPEKVAPLTSGALFSSATMAARVLAVVAAVGTSILPKIVVPIGVGGLALLGIAFYFLKQNKNGVEGGRLKLTNPFELTTVLKFGLFLTAITAATKLLTRIGTGQGVYVLALFSGIADVDAMTLSMSRQAADPASVTLAANAILIVVAVNTVAKAVIGWMTGGAEFGKRMMAAAAIAITAGGATLLLPSLS
ncbi:MAG: MgtC/SapB family protein [Hyphomicrobium sp.]